MPKKLNVLLLFNCPTPKPRGYDFAEELADPENMYTENDVHKALVANGHSVRVLGLCKDVSLLFDEVREFPPDVIFNLVEVFNNVARFDKNIAAVLEMLDIPYTGATTDNLLVCNNKALSKKILTYHRIKVPQFHTFKRGHRIWLPRRLWLPCIIKPLDDEASRGISQASIVDNEESFVERIRFIQESMNADAIAEEYIDGRELYVTVFGKKRLTVFPVREMKFGQLPEDEPRIATYKAKWDVKYQDKWGIKSVYAGKLADGVLERINETCKRAYRALDFKSYVRFDIRVTADGRVYIIEPNANPCIARVDEVAESAAKLGITYNDLIRKIVLMALA